jgi:hypothetical protein
MTDSPYLQRATDLDAQAVSIANSLIQSLTLIHGGALIAIPAFAGPFKPILESPMFGWIFGFFVLGLTLVIAAGIFAFFALARRSDESLELSRRDRVDALESERHLINFRRLRRVAAGLLVASFLCLVLASGISVYIINAMHLS